MTRPHPEVILRRALKRKDLWKQRAERLEVLLRDVLRSDHDEAALQRADAYLRERKPE